MSNITTLIGSDLPAAKSTAAAVLESSGVYGADTAYVFDGCDSVVEVSETLGGIIEVYSEPRRQADGTPA